MVDVKLITFEEILPIWETYLWPSRNSKIEPYSAIEYLSLPYSYNGDYMREIPSFFALFLNKKLIGVNSGHRTGDMYRSRGLFVFSEYRGNNYGTILLQETTNYARSMGHNAIWSIPRQQSLKAYNLAGFTQTSAWFETETSDYNAYAISDFR